MPLALVKLARMQPGPLSVESEVGDVWRSHLNQFQNGSALQHFVDTCWPAVAAVLQLEAGQTVYLAARSPSRLLISRQGEPTSSRLPAWASQARAR